jgi:predicted lipoprotein with Yx(FWY)xxD motif
MRGSTQAVYNGHPRYTYIADTAPGQAHGNNLIVGGPARDGGPGASGG